ncbi:MAG: hypothetical protein BWY70_01791 [Bacteroidetes bacterium ADurb.Bin408]|nr:MAG: hypothetical protein BWY70_01791 [Bacteroidetes bacterium ADurb.Bin408]
MLYTDTAQNPLWETGVPAKPFFDSAYTPPYALCTRLTTPYDTNALASFELRIPNYMFTNMIVGFRHKYQTDTLTDGGYIEVSYDHGQSWINAIYDTTYLIYHTENFYTLQDTLAGGIHGFSGTSAGWVHSRIQWVWAMLVKDIPDTLYMRFTFKSDAIQTNKAGWMIDNLVVSFADMPGFLPKLNPEIDITVYPNPFSTSTYILLPETYRKTAIINLYDLSGKHLQKINSYQNRLCILQRNNLKSGTYILHVNVPGHQSLYKKIIIE